MANESDEAYEVFIEGVFDDEGEPETDDAPESNMSASARLLAARRAIEARREARRMAAELDYLEYDIEDE